MHDLLSKLSIQVNPNVFLKNPESSELGRRIVEGSIDLIDLIGFEAFTFKKLAAEINSTEASIYRYFESKHKLLLYLTSWYWGWVEYRLVFSLANLEDPAEKLLKAICILTSQVEEDSSFTHVNEVKLYNIVIAESPKAYLTKVVDEENKEGVFSGYKQLVSRVSQLITDMQPDYKYPHMLISTVIEGAHHQRFFATHLPKLTDSLPGEDSISEFYKEIVFSAIKAGK
jgi:AcrR family transcriptional regulator